MSAVLAALGLVLAQSSSSYRLVENVLNAGGPPALGASYRLSLHAIGESVVDNGLSSASYRLDAGFVPLNPPPGEVRAVRWDTKTDLAWNPEKSVGTYSAYKDTLTTFPGNFGACFATNVPTEGTTDPASPAAGTGWFYLVTAENRLGEEGTKGSRSNGAERGNSAPCP